MINISPSNALSKLTDKIPAGIRNHPYAHTVLVAGAAGIIASTFTSMMCSYQTQRTEAFMKSLTPTQRAAYDVVQTYKKFPSPKPKFTGTFEAQAELMKGWMKTNEGRASIL